MMVAIPDFADVQQLVLRASSCGGVWHRVVQFTTAEGGRAWLAELPRWLPPQYGPRGSGTKGVEVALGLSYCGLEALAVPDGYLHIFRQLAPAFAAGAVPRAAARLGDSGENSPTGWDAAFTARDAHALLTLHFEPAQKDTIVDRFSELMLAHPQVRPLGDAMYGEHQDPLPDHKVIRGTHRVHFGYCDGLTSTHIRGDGATEAKRVHEPGELLLGEVRDLGDNPWSLVAAPHEVRDFFRHGSFGVLRRIQQFEDRFQEQVARWARYIANDMGLKTDEETLAQVRHFVRAKLCGRWPDGQLVRPEDLPNSMPTTQPQRDEEIDFSGDKAGWGCPLGAHLRRMNPRGQGVALTRPRPLFRRGMPWGPWYEKEPEEERGLLGMFFCSSLEDQFEHLLGEWADRMPIGFVSAGDAKDPLVGGHEDPLATFVVPRQAAASFTKGQPGLDRVAPAPWRLYGFEPFVRTRGTFYGFYPAHGGLERIVRANWALEEEPWPVR